MSDPTDTNEPGGAGRFAGVDLNAFWKDADWAREDYTDAAPTPELVKAVEDALGYRLPAAWVALAQTQNGGMPTRTCHLSPEPTTWAEDHVALNGIFSIGFDPMYSVCGHSGSAFWIEEWNYPPLGIYFADCPSAGHDMLALDYRACGPTGEPSVVHVDQDNFFKITPLAPSFEAFIQGLRPSEEFDPDDDDEDDEDY